jgi:hypothetical protein
MRMLDVACQFQVGFAHVYNVTSAWQELSYYIGSADRGEGSKVETTDLSLATPKPVYRGWGFDTRCVPRRLR